MNTFGANLTTTGGNLIGSALGAASQAGADMQAFASSLPPPPTQPAAAPTPPVSPQAGAAQVAGVPDWLNQLIAKNAPQLANDPDFIRTVAAGAKAESGWDPNRVQQGYAMGSGAGARGLFQFDMGGMGAGMSEEQLLGQQGAELQAARIVPLYAKAYQSAPAGLSGAERAAWVAAQAERPLGYDDPNSAARRNYATAYGEIGGEGLQGAWNTVKGAAVGALSQFGDQQLSSDEAYAACGPAAATSARLGRSPARRRPGSTAQHSSAVGACRSGPFAPPARSRRNRPNRLGPASSART